MTVIEELEKELGYSSVETLEEISTEIPEGEQEKKIIGSLISQGESIKIIQDICSDLDLGLNLDIVDNVLERYQTLTQDNNFIYVPSINLYVAKERTHLGENWFECHKLLQANNERMLILPEFIEFLKYTRENHPDIYEDITAVRNPWRAEWLDADFKVKQNKLFLNYNHILDSKGNLVPKKSELLDKDTLMTNRTPGISIDNYLNSAHTIQWLPTKRCSKGDLYYWAPMKNNNSVARFGANSGRASLNCYWNPSDQDSSLGVRAVRHA